MLSNGRGRLQTDGTAVAAVAVLVGVAVPAPRRTPGPGEWHIFGPQCSGEGANLSGSLEDDAQNTHK